jgi:radical SAM protein with 4Fe4S-binding SPASM domain
MINPSMLTIPKDLVYFHAISDEKILLLNPEIGAYTTTEPHIFKEFQDWSRLQKSQDSAPKNIQSLLEKLILKRIIYYGDFRPKINNQMPEVPYSIYWETTHGCSLRCEYCYMRADTVLPGELTTKEAKDLISSCAEIGVKRFVFTGGEPLVRNDIFELGIFAKSLGLSTEIITNSTLITSAEIAKRVKNSFDYIITSLDGGCENGNDVHRGVGSFRKIVTGILNLNIVGVKPTINSTVSESNVAYIKNLLDFVQNDIAINQHRIINLGFLGRGSESDLDYQWQTYMKTFDEIQSKKLNSKKIVEKESQHVNTTSKKETLKPRKNCGMGSGEFYVDSQGNVYPCKLVTEPQWRSGNIRENSLISLIKSHSMNTARDMDVMSREGCRTCVIRRLCGGGCRGIHMGKSGDAHKNDPQFCWILRHQMTVNLWTFEELSDVVRDVTAFIPKDFWSDMIWKPEIGTALPLSELERFQHLLDLQNGRGALNIL